MKSLIVLFPFFIPLCFLNLSFITSAATSHCLGHQQFLLLYIKRSLVFNHRKSKKLVHWNQSIDCCEWNGVACNKGQVIGLDLSQEFIIGGLDNSSIFNFQHLQSLNLAHNDFASMIPSKFGLLKKLRYLNLSNAGFEGQIPIEIALLTKLAVLDLSTSFTSLDALKLHNPNIGVLMQNLTEIRELYLDGVVLSAGGAEWCRPLTSWQNLEVLSMSSCNLSGPINSSPSNCEFNETLPFSMPKLNQLVHLDLSFNNLVGLFPFVNMSKNLKYLSLLQNDFTGPISSIHWEGLSNLVSLNLGDNAFTGKISSTLFTLPSIQELTLSHNRFDGILEEFPNASLSSLWLIDLSNNQLQGPTPMSLFQLKNIHFLQLSFNQFNGTLKLEKIWRMPNLRTLGISHSNLSLDTAFNDYSDLSSIPSKLVLLLASCKMKEFPTILRNQYQLSSLDLSDNQIRGEIPNWIWSFEYMVYLNLSNNFLTSFEGPLENISFESVMVDLHSNQLRGSIPIFIKYAFLLDYSSNKFSHIPSNFRENIHVTHFLSLANNSFHGNVPQSFCNISTLRMLDLSFNQFNGSIPECLTSTSSSALRVLNLEGNKLTGSISDTISSSCELRFLNLNGNLLKGTIPKSLTNCHSLDVLNLGNNQLSDRFPCFLRNISTLKVLALRSNNLFGPVRCQHSTGHWDMLHIVDLASNNFTGELSGELLQSWIRMRGDEGMLPEKSGNLNFDIYGFHQSVRLNDVLWSFNKVIVMRVIKVEALTPYSAKAVENMYTYFVNAYQLQWGGAYLDSVTVVYKGLQRNFVKIPTVMASMDLSSNSFGGPLPQVITTFKALIVLNLSHNAFSSHIPSSVGNLKHLESLDLSDNSLSGQIPSEIASLSFLSVLNLSFNHLEGRIPTGTQIQSFEADSFIGNEGLCGPPLSRECGASETQGVPTPIDWNFLSVELGFIFGFGFFVLPLVFWKRWSSWYSNRVEDLLSRIFPQLFS